MAHRDQLENVRHAHFVGLEHRDAETIEADEGAPHGTLVLAEEQLAGRGRRGRGFVSRPEGNLFFTLVLRLGLADHHRLPLAVPLAVAEACRAEGVPALVKWPNDTWVDGLKVSGMLIDAELGESDAIALPGIGINVNGDPSDSSPELVGVATSLRKLLGREVDREQLLARLCNALEVNLGQPAGELVARYRALSLIVGKRVLVSPVAGSPFEGTAEAVDEDGSLLVRRQSGKREVVTAADVSLRPLS